LSSQGTYIVNRYIISYTDIVHEISGLVNSSARIQTPFPFRKATTTSGTGPVRPPVLRGDQRAQRVVARSRGRTRQLRSTPTGRELAPGRL